ncbi:MAG: hypothetical protein ISR52_09985, partial [Rhodospirillales bacterium]|nr:hypothetical protein [Rhodospirillales bacterium]
MSWSKAIVLSLSLSLVSGCGFRPLHGTQLGATATAELAAIEIKPIADRLGQQLHNNLIDMLTPRGHPQEPRYILTVSVTSSVQGLAVRKSALATRANVRLAATFSLRRKGTAEPLMGGTSLIVSSYNVIDSDFASLKAEEGVKKRGVEQLADDIRTKLAVYFSQRRT